MSVTLISSDNEAFTLSQDMVELSARLAEMTQVSNNIEIEIPFVGDDINLVLESVEAVINTETNISGDPIFYRLVTKIDAILEKHDVMHVINYLYIADYLEIESLIDIFTYKLVDYINEYVTYKSSTDEINQVLTDQIKDLSIKGVTYLNLAPEVIKYLRKHLFIGHFNKIQYTAGDSITGDVVQEGSKGKPRLILDEFKNITSDGYIFMTVQRITSLHGLNDAPNADLVPELLLGGNYIISPYMDTYDVRTPFTKFKRLEKMTLADNPLYRLPGSFFLGLVNLTELFLTRTRLTEIPTGLFNNTPKLSRLSLHSNALTSIDDEFQSLTALQELDLGHNQIDVIKPTAFYTNISLTRLVVDHNYYLRLTPSHFDRSFNLTSMSVDEDTLTERMRDRILARLPQLYFNFTRD